MAKYCSNCGNELPENAYVCVKCGVKVSDTPSVNEGAKSKIAAGLFGIFLGAFGVHNFYLGYTGKAVTQLVLSIVGLLLSCVAIGIPIVMGVGIWALVEAVMILVGKIDKDGKGNPLAD